MRVATDRGLTSVCVCAVIRLGASVNENASRLFLSPVEVIGVARVVGGRCVCGFQSATCFSWPGPDREAGESVSWFCWCRVVQTGKLPPGLRVATVPEMKRSEIADLGRTGISSFRVSSFHGIRVVLRLRECMLVCVWIGE